MDALAVEAWRKTINGLRKTANDYMNTPKFPMMEEITPEAIEAELNMWEGLAQGSKDRITQMAKDEYEHLIYMEEMKRRIKKINISNAILIFVIFLELTFFLFTFLFT